MSKSGTKLALQATVGILGAVAAGSTTFCITSYLQRKSVLKIAQNLKDMGCCPNCAQKMDATIANGGRTPKTGI